MNLLSRTFILCVLLIASFTWLALGDASTRTTALEQFQWFVLALAGLWTGNDIGGALRERAQRPATTGGVHDA